MTKKFTHSLTLFLLIIFFRGSCLVAATSGKVIAADLPAIEIMQADSPKKEQVPPPQMVTFPVSSITAKMTLNGYSQVRYQYNFTDPALGKPANGFDIRNARLILRGTVLKNLAYNFQADFAPPTVRLMDASAAYTYNKFAKLTIGQQKVPLSYESLRTDYDIHSLSRSQAVEALTARSRDVLATANSTTAVNNNGRDIGLLFSGGIPNAATNANWVDYSFGLFNGSGINVSDADAHKDIAGRIVARPIKNLAIGGSFYNGKATYGGDKKTPKDRNRLGFDVAYEDGKRIYAAFEYLQGVDSATNKGGYYGLLEGYIIPKKFAVLVKYDSYDPNKDKDKDATSVTSFGLNYYFAQFTKIQLQYDMRHEDGADTQKKNDLLSVQAQIFF